MFIEDREDNELELEEEEDKEAVDEAPMRPTDDDGVVFDSMDLNSSGSNLLNFNLLK